MTTEINEKEHEEIMSLLPWFVNQSLEEPQATMVANHIELCDECKREVKLLGSISDVLQGDAQTRYQEHANVDSDLQSVMERIDAYESPVQSPATGASLIQQLNNKIAGLFSGFPGALQGATALAGVLLVVVALQLYNKQSDDDYSVLSSSNSSASTIRFSVEIDTSIDSTSARSAMHSVFDNYAETVVIEKGVGATYVIVVTDDIDVGQLNEIVLELNDQESVKRVELLP